MITMKCHREVPSPIEKMKEKLWYLLADLPWTNLSIPEYRSDDYSLEPEDTSLYAAEKQDILNF